MGEVPCRPHDEVGAQPVHRAQGEKKQAFALGVAAGAPREEDFQQKTKKTVQQKIPEQDHEKTPFIYPDRIGIGGSIHTGGDCHKRGEQGKILVPTLRIAADCDRMIKEEI